jgi:hypothetical protein
MLCRVMVLEDNDLVHLRGGLYEVFNAGPARPKSAAVAGAGAGANGAAGTGKGSSRLPATVSRALLTLEMEVSQIMKVRSLCVLRCACCAVHAALCMLPMLHCARCTVVST